MAQDRSRSAFDVRKPKHWSSLQAQQGRLLSDDDWNEADAIDKDDLRHVHAHVIGPAGSPDDGFRLSNPRVSGTAIDFDLLPGTMYVGGLRVTLEQSEAFSLQRDWLQQPASERPALGNAERIDLAYLEVWQQPVTAVEDDELQEVALGGPDTSVRLRTMRRVRLRPNVGTESCATAWAGVVTSLGGLVADNELRNDATLTVGYVPNSGPATDLCSPSAQLGYLGAENQAIRVEVGAGNTFLWGFDNASPLYRVQVTTDASGAQVIHFPSPPRDEAHWPLAQQIVELLPWSAVLPNGEKIAEAAGGFLTRVSASYDPNTQNIKVNPAVPATFGAAWQSRADAGSLGTSSSAFFYLRVWNRGADVASPPQIAFTPGTAVPLTGTGLQITFGGTTFRQGDFWIIAARPRSPAKVVPWSLETGRVAEGVRRFYAPLGLIRWRPGGTHSVIDDCRQVFPPLTRLRGCCTYTVGDQASSFGQFTSIQAAVDALPLDGGKVCVLAGTYTESVTIVGRRNVTIEGCGRRTVLRPTVGTQYTILIAGGRDITVRSLAIDSPDAFGIVLDDLFEKGPQFSLKSVFAKSSRQRVIFEGLAIAVASYAAIAAFGGRGLTIRDCDIVAGPLAEAIGRDDRGRWSAIVSFADDVLIENNRIAAPSESPALPGATTPAGVPTFTRTATGGIQIGSGAERVEIRRNQIEGGNGDGVTLGSWAWAPRQQQPDLEWSTLVSKWTWFPSGISIIINDDGCIEITWDPPPPGGGDGGEDLVPVSMGDVYDVRIIDNSIRRMGRSGIGVVRFFDLSARDEIVGVRGLLVDGNRIQQCLRLPIPELPRTMRDVAAAGAITLAEVSAGLIRDNDISENGRRHFDPVCGVFALRSTGLVLEQNRIVDNAPRVNSDEPARPGWRGGIVLTQALPPQVLIETGLEGLDQIRRQSGEPAVRIADNIVVVPDGRALLVIGIGTMAIVDNNLTSRGVGRSDLTPAFTNTTVFSEAPTARSPLVARVLAQGVLQPLFDLLGGVVVTVANLGLSNELFLQLQYYAQQDDDPEPGPGLDALPAVAASGQILFDDNQVGLDLLAKPTNLILSAVVLFTLDDLAVADNQVEVDAEQDLVLITALLFGFSTRVCGNRIKEPLRTFRRAVGLSAWSHGFLMNTTVANQSSRCITVTGARRQDELNMATTEVFSDVSCRKKLSVVNNTLAARKVRIEE